MEPNGLLYRVYPSSQFDQVEYGIGALKKVFGNIIEQIGEELVAFSELEHTLDICIADLLSLRSHQLGMTVTKSLDYMQKVMLYHDLASGFIEERSAVIRVELSTLRKELQYIGEMRNVVAHAKWMTITRDVYVRSQVRTSKTTGLPEIKYYKLNKRVLQKIVSRTYISQGMLDDLNQKVIEDLSLS